MKHPCHGCTYFLPLSQTRGIRSSDAERYCGWGEVHDRKLRCLVCKCGEDCTVREESGRCKIKGARDGKKQCGS